MDTSKIELATTRIAFPLLYIKPSNLHSVSVFSVPRLALSSLLFRCIHVPGNRGCEWDGEGQQYDAGKRHHGSVSVAERDAHV